jgi:hypothetical protein
MHPPRAAAGALPLDDSTRDRALTRPSSADDPEGACGALLAVTRGSADADQALDDLDRIRFRTDHAGEARERIAREHPDWSEDDVIIAAEAEGSRRRRDAEAEAQARLDAGRAADAERIGEEAARLETEGMRVDRRVIGDCGRRKRPAKTLEALGAPAARREARTRHAGHRRHRHVARSTTGSDPGDDGDDAHAARDTGGGAS